MLDVGAVFRQLGIAGTIGIADQYPLGGVLEQELATAGTAEAGQLAGLRLTGVDVDHELHLIIPF